MAYINTKRERERKREKNEKAKWAARRKMCSTVYDFRTWRTAWLSRQIGTLKQEPIVLWHHYFINPIETGLLILNRQICAILALLNVPMVGISRQRLNSLS